MKRLATVFAVAAACMAGAYAPSASADPSPGTFCTKDQEGKTEKTGDGTSLTCSKGPDGRARWSASDATGVGAGTFCTKDQEGKTGKANDGTAVVCSKGSDGRDRWTKK